MNKVKETNELKWKRFEEACRRYLYEKELMKELEKRYVNLNYGSVHYNSHIVQTDSLKRYRVLENHIKHVDDVFASIEKQYGTKNMHQMKDSMLHIKSMEDTDAYMQYRNSILHVLNQSNALYKTSV